MHGPVGPDQRTRAEVTGGFFGRDRYRINLDRDAGEARRGVSFPDLGSGSLPDLVGGGEWTPVIHSDAASPDISYRASYYSENTRAHFAVNHGENRTEFELVRGREKGNSIRRGFLSVGNSVRLRTPGFLRGVYIKRLPA